jgi:hypothetical protein
LPTGPLEFQFAVAARLPLVVDGDGLGGRPQAAVEQELFIEDR